MRQHDWSATPLGPPGQWPQALCSALGICLQSSFPAAIYWGRDLRLLYNDAFAPIPGEKHPWALGKPARDVWSDIWHVLEPQFRDVLDHARGLSTFDQMLPMQRGERVEETYWNYSFTPILDERGDVAGIFNQGNETTEQVLAARKREAEADRLRDLFQQAPAAVALLQGPQHVFAMANPAYLELVGNREVVGKPVAEALPEIVAQGYTAVLDDVFRSGEAYTGRSTRVMLYHTPGAEPEERVLDFVYQPINSAAGRVTGILVQATDVTQWARTERALRQSEAELRNADRRKDEFLATLAHELRNPLAPILNASRLIQARETADETVSRATDIVVRQVRHMVRLIDDLLDVARITRGRIELRVQRVRLDTIVRNAVEAAEPLIEEKGHELAVELPEEPLLLDGDPVRLAQALSNILNNAARYTPPGGRIVIRAGSNDDRIRISITDTGVGIRSESLESIFDLFTQGDPTSERGVGGLGIGLHLARELLALHGGTLTAGSEGPGCGSEFVLTLPAGKPPVSASQASGKVADSSVPRRRVLVVDDNADAANSLAMNLELAGHDIRTAYTGTEALETLEAFSPDVVLLDIGLPGMDGYEVAHAIRLREAGGDVTLVAITGWGQSNDRRRAARAGFDDFLTKPVDPDVVARLVRNVKLAAG